MANHGFSAAVALVLALVAIAGGQLFKETLAASRQGTLIAGGKARSHERRPMPSRDLPGVGRCSVPEKINEKT